MNSKSGDEAALDGSSGHNVGKRKLTEQKKKKKFTALIRKMPA